MTRDLIIGLDSGTSVSKAVAFDLDGRQVASASRPNDFRRAPADGAVEQDMGSTWARAAQTLRELVGSVDEMSSRVRALAVTGQGDGTWLMDAEGEPVAPAWLWLDARAAPIVEEMAASGARDRAYQYTGCGMNASNQSGHLVWLSRNAPQVLDRAATACHCKDWLYYCLTGERVTDISEGNFTFGNFRTRAYQDEVIHAYGLEAQAHLLPPMVDGSEITAPLTEAAAVATGLPVDTPVSLGYVDVLCSALGAGIYSPEQPVALSIVGSTGMHMVAMPTESATLDHEPSGYIMPFMVPGYCSQMQSNMAATLNIDWVVDLALQASKLAGATPERKNMLLALDAAAASATPAAALYHPYIHPAGERGPFFNADARAQLFGFSDAADLPALMRAVYEGLALAARDCYTAVGAGAVPDVSEIRMAGGGGRSTTLRRVFADVLGVPVRESTREEAGAAGAAMMAGVATGVFADYDEACARWVEPTLGARIEPHASRTSMYAALFELYQSLRTSAPPHWRALAAARSVPTS